MSNVEKANKTIALRAKQPHIAVDFDGTLVDNSEWRGIEWAGAPIPRMVARVKAALARGWKVSIFTARVSPRFDDEDETWGDEAVARKFVEDWTEKHLGQRLPVTAVKWGYFTEFWDDKAVAVRANSGYTRALGIQRYWSELTAAMAERDERQADLADRCIDDMKDAKMEARR